MTSPSSNRRSSLVTIEDGHYPSSLHTRTGTLTNLMQSRSHQSLHSPRNLSRSRRHYGSDDEESARGRPRNPRPADDDEIEALLRDETRLSQILHGPQVRSMNLFGKSNPRYRWERYWKSEEELADMKPAM